MGRLWGALLALLMLTVTLAPTGQASVDDTVTEDCTTIRYTITPELSGRERVCKDASGWNRTAENLTQPLVDLRSELAREAPDRPDPLEEIPGIPPLPEPPDPGDHVPEPPGIPETGENEVGFCSGGVDVTIMGKRSYVCWSYDYSHPNGVIPDGPPSWQPGVEPCPQGTHGYLLVSGDTRVGACVIEDHRYPRDLVSTDVSVETEPCEVGAQDPRVNYGGGAVAVCVVPVLELGDPKMPAIPDIEIILEPCAEDAADPGVRINDGGLLICIRYQIEV